MGPRRAGQLSTQEEVQQTNTGTCARPFQGHLAAACQGRLAAAETAPAIPSPSGLMPPFAKHDFCQPLPRGILHAFAHP